MYDTASNFKIMKPHKYLTYIFLMFLTFLIESCETIIDVDLPDHQPTLVINTLFADDTTFTILVHQNKDILDSDYDFSTVSNATVELFEDGDPIGSAYEAEPGRYLLNHYPRAESQYSIQVSKQGFLAVESSDILPYINNSIAVDEIKVVKDEYGGEQYQLTYSFQDQPGDDFYEVVLFTYYPMYEYYEDEDTSYYFQVGNYKEYIYYNDVGATLNEFEDGYDNVGMYSDELFDGKKHSKTIEFYTYFYYEEVEETDQKIYLELRHVSEAYYRYQVSKTLQANAQDNPFAEAAPVFNNIQNGFGIFAGYSTEVTAIDFSGN